VPLAALLAFVPAGAFAAAMLSVAIVRALDARPTSLLTMAVLSKGPEKVATRLMQLAALAFLPWFLRRIGWHGRRDCGFSAPGSTRAGARRDVLLGLGLGLGSLALLAALQVAAGQRVTAPVRAPSVVFGWLGSFALSAALVGLAEETLARGILYRALARLWGGVRAAVALALLFAFVHFLRPTAGAFAEADRWTATLEVFRTTFAAAPAQADFAVRFANLALLSLLLAAFVARSGTIWLAVGTHAGWVFGLRLNSKLTDLATGIERSPWFGIRPELTDSWLAAALLAAMLAATLAARRAPQGGGAAGRGGGSS
jgi:membrane protease YdiL (CAAX protease family)